MSEALRIQVERVVRPVLASLSRKMQWREELYTLICSIHEEELARKNSADEALRVTLERFGDPQALSVELATSVGWMERTLNHLEEAWLYRRQGESILRHALRIGLIHLVMVASLMVTVIPLAAVIRSGMPHRSPPPLMFMVALPAMLFVDSFLLTWLGETLCMSLQDARSAWKRPSLWLASVLAGLIVTLGGAGLVASVSTDLRDVWEAGFAWLLRSPAIMALFVVVTQLFLREHRRLCPWQGLQLD